MYVDNERKVNSMDAKIFGAFIADAVFTSTGVMLPLFCIFGFIILLCNAIWRKITGKSCGQTFVMALALLLLLILFMGMFFLIGASGIGPVPN